MLAVSYKYFFTIIFLLFLCPNLGAQGLDCKLGYFQSRYNCGIYTITGGSKIPDILVTAKNVCEMNHKLHGCDQLAKENPESAKYIQSCDYKFICSRQVLEENTTINFAIKCMEGASDVLEDYTKLFAFIKKVKATKDAAYEACNKDLVCKRQLARGIPEFEKMDDATLAKYNSVYIENQKMRYENQMAENERDKRVREFDQINDKRIISAEITREVTRDREVEKQEIDDFNNSSAEMMLKKFGDAKKNAEKAWHDMLGIKAQCYDSQFYTRWVCAKTFDAVFGIQSVKLVAVGAKNGVKLVSKKLIHPLERRGILSAKPLHENDLRTFVRGLFSERNLSKRATSDADNEAFIKIAASEVELPGTLFMRVENAFLKKINDLLKDKNFITSINNKYNELVQKRVAEVLKSYPDIKNEFKELTYQGFKEIEYNFLTKSGKDIPESFKADLAKALGKAGEDLDFYLVHNDLIRKSDVASGWYKAGFGKTGDRANIASRVARDQKDKMYADFDDSAIVRQLEEDIAATKDLARAIEKDFPKEFLDDVPGTHFKVVNVDILALSRKFPKVGEFLEQIKIKTGIRDISFEAVSKIKKLQEKSDQFSPPVRNIARENASFTLTDGTQVGIDYRDVGALNAQMQMRALLQSGSVKDAIKNSRTNFNLATDELNRRKQQFEDILIEIVEERRKKDPDFAFNHAKSGDDGVATFSGELTPKEIEDVARRWAKKEASVKGGKPSSARFSIPNPKVKDIMEKNKLATHGESIEKRLRERLNGLISNRDFNDLTIMVKMQGEKSGMGRVDIFIATGGKNKLTRDEIKKIAEEYKQAIKDINNKGDPEEGSRSFRYVSNQFQIE